MYNKISKNYTNSTFQTWFLIFFVGISSAVIIDSNGGLKIGSYRSNSGKAWQMVKLYSPNSPPIFKYDFHVRSV